MKVYRIKLTSWTASFRYPNIMSGYQPTLLVPPVSTVLGILNSCAGKYLVYDKLDIGYYFEYGGKISDIETIYQVELNSQNVPMNQMKSNIIRREILSDAQLYQPVCVERQPLAVRNIIGCTVIPLFIGFRTGRFIPEALLPVSDGAQFRFGNGGGD